MKNRIIAVLILAMIWACGSDRIQRIDKLNSKDSLPDLTVKNVEVLYSDSAKVRMKLVAPLVKDYTPQDQKAKGHTVFPEGLDVLFFDKMLKPESSLRANYGFHDAKTDVWEYKGNVVIVNLQKDTLRTEHLFANRTKDSLYTTEPVSIKKADGSLIKANKGMYSNLSFTKYQLIDMKGSKFSF
jgi:LPS export ABC transporter protein LptC